MKDRNIKLSFCEVLGDLISESGKTLSDIAKDTGLTAASLSKWRDGKSDIGSVNLCILAEYFHVSTDFLLGLSKSQYRVDDLPDDKKNLEYSYYPSPFNGKSLIIDVTNLRSSSFKPYLSNSSSSVHDFE